MPERAQKGRRIGEVAASAGITADTLRYYEREGLVPAPARTTGGFRVYAPETIQLLRLIKQAQGLGLSLRAIRRLFGRDARRGRERCEQVRDAIAQRLADVDLRIEELRAFRSTLQVTLRECDEALTRRRETECPVVEHAESVSR